MKHGSVCSEVIRLVNVISLRHLLPGLLSSWMTFMCPSTSLLMAGVGVLLRTSVEFSCLKCDSQSHYNSFIVVCIFLLQFLTVVEVNRSR